MSQLKERHGVFTRIEVEGHYHQGYELHQRISSKRLGSNLVEDTPKKSIHELVIVFRQADLG